ncbi:hypothetical protein [Arthrospiribacter ruber]|uniref:hypothetical protein n=1 Tax=Arthrospiribacter ruber TaxID=2487934 RepID=UPI001FECE4AE|nr:hypothetical protein [Arthrospiribacter ruber]
MQESGSKNKVRRIFRKKFFRIGGLVLFILALIQVAVYFSSDFLLRNYLKEKVSEASDSKYEIDFDRFYVSLFERGVHFVGLKINPVEEVFDELDSTAYYRADIPRLSITGLNYLFRKREVVIGRLEVNSPELDFRLKIEGMLEEELDESPLEILQQEIKKSFLGSKLNEIRIRNMQVNDADVLLKNFIAQKSIKAENSNLYIRDIQLLQERSPETPFNAEGFAFDMDNFQVLLADSVHTVFAGEIEVSSLDQYIKGKNLSIEPDFEKYSETYFKADLDDLLLSDADINKVFYTSEVVVGQLILQKPSIDLYTRKGESRNQDLEAFELYDLIDGILASISIETLSIDEGRFTQSRAENRDNRFIQAERIDFKMEGFYVGPESSKKDNQFFYADDASVELFDVQLILGDSVHQINGAHVLLSSFEDKIQIDGFHLFPFEDYEPDLNKTLLDIQVPNLSISEANLKKIYNQGIIDLQRVIIEKPEILLRDVQGKVDETGNFNISEIYSEFLEGIYVKRFEIKEGSLIVDNRVRVRQDSLSFGKVNLILENFALDDRTENSEAKSFFWAENLELELQEYALKLADNLHVFKADRVFLDTKRSQISIDGFVLEPFDRSQIQSTLDRYGKKTTLDIFVPKFTATGVDIRKAYFDGILNIRDIRVPSPKISIIRHRPGQEEEDREGVDQQEILDLLTNYFSEIKVERLSLQQGTLNYENYVRDRIRTFAEENVSISVRNFYLNKDASPEELRSLFSEEVDLQLNNYVFNIADGKYNILADRINFNTAKEEIIASNVSLNPRRNFTDKTRVSVTIPEMAFRGVDLEGFLFENELKLEMVKFTGSDVNILINNDLDEEDTSSPRRGRRDRSLPKTIDVISIDTIQAEEAQFKLAFREGGSQRELINTGINLAFYDFLLDSAIIGRGDISGFFSGLSLDIDEFWLTLPDSMHQVTFSKVELDTRYEGVLVNNFRIIPKELSGKPGVPIFSGHIPTALIKTNKLADLQESGELIISELRLFRPDIEVFVDQEKKSRSSPEENGDNNEASLVEKLKIGEFEIVEGDVFVFQKNGSKDPQGIKNLNFVLADLDLELSELEQLDPKDFLDKEFRLSFPDYEFNLPDSLNKVSVGYVALENKEIILKDIVFEPRYGKYAYTRKVGYQTDVAKIRIPEIVISEADLEKFLEEEVIIAKKVLIKGAVTDLFRDKRFEKKEDKYRPMPQLLMKTAGYSVHLDTLEVLDGTIIYTEFPENGMVPGVLVFDQLNASLFPFRLEKEEIEYGLDEANLVGSTKLFGEADLSVNVKMFFKEPYPMDVSANIGEFDIRIINPILENNAFLRALDGKVNGGDWNFRANDKDAAGLMTLLYQDLKLELLDERTLQRGKGRKAILTFVLNVFAVKSNNPRKLFGNTVRSRIYQERETNRFIFNYWWTSTLSGLKGSLGLGQPQIPKRRAKEEDEDNP